VCISPDAAAPGALHIQSGLMSPVGHRVDIGMPAFAARLEAERM
jgi:hypothetical protein